MNAFRGLFKTLLTAWSDYTTSGQLKSTNGARNLGLLFRGFLSLLLQLIDMMREFVRLSCPF